MARHRSFRSPAGDSTNTRAWSNDFDNVPEQFDDLDFCPSSAFDRESKVLRAPEMDDLHDTDDLTPLWLAVPSEFRPNPRDELRAHDSSVSSYAYRDSHTDVSDGFAATDVIPIGTRRGAHRKPQTSALRSRLMIAAMAAGATAAGAYTMGNADKTAATETVLAAGQAAATGDADDSAGGMQIVTIASTTTEAVHAEEITKAAAFAQERAEREARLARPLFVMPTSGIRTSGFGYRWGALHGGIDIANSIGTPVLAASDGVVIAAGPTGGYGNQVKLRHSDGTVTLYGHLSAILVNIGERVMAGDQIAKMGSTGNSTGPHLHFEVLLNGTQRVDPAPWLAKRGIGTGGYLG